MKIKNRVMDILIYLFMILSVLGTCVFLIFLIQGSFMGNQTLTNAYGMIKDGNNAAEYATFHLLTNHISFENYLNSLWNTSDFWFYFWNSMIYTVPILLGTLIISVFAGYAFAKFQFPLRRFWMVIFIIVMMIPYQAMISPTYIVLNSIKLINTRWSIILPNIFTPFGCYLIYQFMRGIPDETIESAKLDGAGHLKILLYVVIPQVRNGIVSLAVLNFIDSWNMVEQPIMYLKNTFLYPLSAGLSYFQNQSLGAAFVCSVVFIIPVMLLFLLGKDYLVEGIKNSVVGKKTE